MVLEQTSLTPDAPPVDPHAADVDFLFDLTVAELSTVTPFRDGVERLGRIEAMRATLFAEEAIELMALVHSALAEAGQDTPIDLVVRSATTEIAITRHVSDRTIQSRISEAWRVVEDFPGTLFALQYGTAASMIAEVSGQERHETARDARSVTRVELDDGMSEIVVTVPTTLAAGIFNRLTQMGNLVKSSNPRDTRTLDQLRSDVITDPVTDMVLATDSYRPGEKLRRYLRMRDGRCRCPSCNRSAWRCDVDHTVPFSQGGSTEVGNLAHLCPGHHTIKHLPGWSLRQLEPGIVEWRTPHGIVAVDYPDAPVGFTA